MPPIYLPSLSAQKKAEFLDSIDTIVTDCDGVLWRPEGVISGAPATVNRLLACGKRIFFVTNNSTKTRRQFHDKFVAHGFDVTVDRLYNTSTLAAQYVREKLQPDQVAYVVGPPSVAAELEERGVKHFGVGPDDVYENFLEHSGSLEGVVELRENVGAVVVGFDRYLNYAKMLKAVTYLRDERCAFVCTNTDEVFPSAPGAKFVLPGTGSIVAGIRVASGREPFLVGKPSAYIAEALRRDNQLDPARTLFVGDRCNTDIRMGNSCAFVTLLVLSGVHTVADVRRYEASSKPEDRLSVPHYYADSINDLCPPA